MTILRGTLKIGSDFLIEGPQFFSSRVCEYFIGVSIGIRKACVRKPAVRADFFENFGLLFGASGRSDVTAASKSWRESSRQFFHGGVL